MRLDPDHPVDHHRVQVWQKNMQAIGIYAYISPEVTDNHHITKILSDPFSGESHTRQLVFCSESRGAAVPRVRPPARFD
jgi:hypothetical protein